MPTAHGDSLPLKGKLIIDFTQFLSGPSATLRLADLGATVIKIERAQVGDISRKLYISDVNLDGDSTLFHAANRNKQSVSVDLKNDEELRLVKELIKRADVVVQNFRPGVIERLGLGYEAVKKLNPKIIYGSITGYGGSGPWKNNPGQDLLVQSLAGLPWLNGDDGDPPVPFGLSVVDMLSGAHLLQGLLACVVRRNLTGEGGLVEVSLMESVIDLQFEVLTAFLNDGGQIPRRSSVNNANAYLPAPYGFYRTQDGYIALAMGSVSTIAHLIDCTPLKDYRKETAWFDKRDEIKRILEGHLRTQPTAHWLSILEHHDIWCAEVLDWNVLSQHDAFRSLSMIQTTRRQNGTTVRTTRCPFRINGEILTSEVGAPPLGEYNVKFVKSLTSML
ncbi:CoA transferase [Alicyclobacillus sp. SO9]|nr:CoA transferase [Alicyclobacillus sp. SO9]